MAKKMVCYNGNILAYPNCSDSRVLVKGKVYEVITAKVYRFHTNYVLKGIIGEFNSICFNDVNSLGPIEEKVYTAVSHEMPIIGERYNCSIVDFTIGHPRLLGWSTSPVKSYKYLGNSVYEILTQNSKYIVTIN